ncbi:TetR/AcrR family transcriptional regulator [Pokkaliibacter sp. CJK22405]|uniref:TetR/AcrR family transcriptional regulator n=1 Tax=Pokkaliibacter sp. CJK22405 TaxID=3384615 RepID=UPI003984B0FD
MENTRQRLITAALELFLRQGIHITGVAAVAAKAKLTKMTLYSHFASKEALVVACLETRDQLWRERVAALLAAEPDPVTAILAFFPLYQAYIEDDSGRGCIFVNSAAEFPTADHPIYLAVRKHKDGVREQLITLAQSAGFSAPAIVGDTVFLLLEGAFARATLENPAEVFMTARQVASHWLYQQLHEDRRQ